MTMQVFCCKPHSPSFREVVQKPRNLGILDSSKMQHLQITFSTNKIDLGLNPRLLDSKTAWQTPPPAPLPRQTSPSAPLPWQTVPFAPLPWEYHHLLPNLNIITICSPTLTNFTSAVFFFSTKLLLKRNEVESVCWLLNVPGPPGTYIPLGAPSGILLGSRDTARACRWILPLVVVNKSSPRYSS